MVARALERIGDNAVDVGEQVVFVVTGLFREFRRTAARGDRHRQRRPAADFAALRADIPAVNIVVTGGGTGRFGLSAA